METHTQQRILRTTAGRLARLYASAFVWFLVFALILRQLGMDVPWISLMVGLVMATPAALWPDAIRTHAQRALTPEAVVRIGLTVFLVCMSLVLAANLL